MARLSRQPRLGRRRPALPALNVLKFHLIDAKSPNQFQKTSDEQQRPLRPLDFLTGRERREWRQVELRALRDHDAQQLTTLRSLAAAGGGLTSLLHRDCAGHTASAEFIIAGKRIQAGRVHRPALRALTQAIAAMPAVPLLAASRYRPYWVLTFQLPAAPLAVLADKLTILPDRHHGSAWPAALTPPAGVRRRPAPAHPIRVTAP